MEKIILALLSGGEGPEREISIRSGKYVRKCLESEKYLIEDYDPIKDLEKLFQDRAKIDLVLPILHGPGGEDGTIQGFLESAKLPYLGSGVLPSALGMNKIASRKIFKMVGLEVPSFITISLTDYNWRGLEFPCLTKPANLGSSIGVRICKDEKELKKGIEEALSYSEVILVEKYIEGIEITGSVVELEKGNPISLPLIEIIPQKEFFSFQAKYDGTTKKISPARIGGELTKKAKEASLRAFRGIGAKDFARVDMIIERKTGKIIVLELNTIPGMTEESLFPLSCKTGGYPFGQVLEKIISNHLTNG